MSISAILPPLTVKAMTEKSFPSSMQTAPAAPLTSAGRRTIASCEKDFARRATCSAPRTSSARPAASVASEDHFRIENSDESLEIAGLRRLKEGVDDAPLSLHVDVGTGVALSDATACAARKLADGLG